MFFGNFGFLHRSGLKIPFFCVEAATTILQGLFFCRIILMEFEKNTLKNLISLFAVQGIIIIIFSSIQIIWQIPGFIPRDKTRVFSPFDDIHSYGSYIALLFFVFLVIGFQKTGKIKFFLMCLASLSFFFILLSASRAAWIATALIGCVFFISENIPQKVFIFDCSFIDLLKFPDVFFANAFKLEKILSLSPWYNSFNFKY